MLKTTSKILCSIALIALTTVISADEDNQWLTDMSQAQKVAKTEGKDIFIFFTGSDWCSLCIRLEDEVLTTEHFLSYAKNNLVLVDLDFPHGDNIITKEQRKHNEKWLETFKLHGFPTIYLADASANAYAVTGYQNGGAVKYVEHLKMLRANKTITTELMTKATKAAGIVRAKLLDEALSNNSAIIDNRKSLVAEIITLSQHHDKALYNKYRTIKGSQNLIRDMNTKLTADSSAEHDLAALLALFDQYSYLKKGRPLSILMQNLALRYSLSSKHDEGIAFMNKVFTDTSYPATTRQTPGIIRAFMTAEKGDIHKAIVLLDEALALAPESEANQNRDLIMKELEQVKVITQ